MVFNVLVDAGICALTLAAFAVWPRAVFCFLGLFLLALLCIVQPWLILGLIMLGLIPVALTASFVLRELRSWNAPPRHTPARHGL